MFDIRRTDERTIALAGRLDATQAALAREFFEQVERTSTVDLSGLEYVSSAGLGVLIATQRRLADRGERLTLRGPTPHVRELLRITGLDLIFEVA